MPPEDEATLAMRALRVSRMRELADAVHAWDIAQRGYSKGTIDVASRQIPVYRPYQEEIRLMSRFVADAAEAKHMTASAAKLTVLGKTVAGGGLRGHRDAGDRHPGHGPHSRGRTSRPPQCCLRAVIRRLENPLSVSQLCTRVRQRVDGDLPNARIPRGRGSGVRSELHIGLFVIPGRRLGTAPRTCSWRHTDRPAGPGRRRGCAEDRHLQDI